MHFFTRIGTPKEALRTDRNPEVFNPKAAFIERKYRNSQKASKHRPPKRRIGIPKKALSLKSDRTSLNKPLAKKGVGTP